MSQSPGKLELEKDQSETALVAGSVSGSVVLVGPNLSFAADGKQAFLDNSYDHRDAEWLDRYLKKEIEIDGKTHRTTFTGSDEDRDAIVQWLAQRKECVKPRMRSTSSRCGSC